MFQHNIWCICVWCMLFKACCLLPNVRCKLHAVCSMQYATLYIYTVQCTGWVKKQGWIARAYNYSSNLFKISRCDRNNIFPHCFLLIKFWVKNIFVDLLDCLINQKFHKYFVKNEITKKMLYFMQDFAIHTSLLSPYTVHILLNIYVFIPNLLFLLGDFFTLFRHFSPYSKPT